MAENSTDTSELKADVRRPIEESELEKEAESTLTKYRPQPTSNAISIMDAAITAGGHKTKLKEMQQNRQDITIQENSIGETKITQTTIRKNKDGTTGTDTTELTIPNIEKLTSSSEKILDVMLEEINDILKNGTLTQDSITIELKDLVDRGIYDNLDTARRGFLNAYNTTLHQLYINGEIKKANKYSPYVKGEGLPDPLFLHPTKPHKAAYNIKLNTYMDWELILRFFTIMPTYAYKLNKHAYKLIKYIFKQARQNTDKLEKQGYFTISLKKIQEELQLSNKSNDPHIKRLIIDEIYHAIENIEEAQNEDFNSRDLTIEPKIKNGNTLEPLDLDDTKLYTAREMLQNGFLKIQLEGEPKAYFSNLAKGKASKIKAQQTKKRREMAAAKKKAKEG